MPAAVTVTTVCTVQRFASEHEPDSEDSPERIMMDHDDHVTVLIVLLRRRVTQARARRRRRASLLSLVAEFRVRSCSYYAATLLGIPPALNHAWQDTNSASAPASLPVRLQPECGMLRT
eukprot:1040593-Rhodomonas_salina.2